MLLTLQVGGCGASKSLQFFCHSFDIHTLEYMLPEGRKEGHDGERNVLLVLFKPAPETGKATFNIAICLRRQDHSLIPCSPFLEDTVPHILESFRDIASDEVRTANVRHSFREPAPPLMKVVSEGVKHFEVAMVVACSNEAGRRKCRALQSRTTRTRSSPGE